MDDADDAQCVRASECARRPARVRNRDGSMRAALSVTNVPLFCFIVSWAAALLFSMGFLT